jgi:hypothetical protein
MKWKEREGRRVGTDNLCVCLVYLAGYSLDNYYFEQKGN